MDKIYILLAWLAGILIVLIFGKSLKVPLKILLRLLLNSLIGGIVIIIINLLGQYIDFQISMNIFSSLIVGTLGVPGVILLVILKYLL
ncbi:MAG TPA: pro-sigmaK processing inhibitor BofA family protein [Thermoclostridium sp.]|nr:pro-sigmaK processing inhibitor BofA family protein [Thermoclostridium sp.]